MQKHERAVLKAAKELAYGIEAEIEATTKLSLLVITYKGERMTFPLPRSCADEKGLVRTTMRAVVREYAMKGIDLDKAKPTPLPHNPALAQAMSEALHKPKEPPKEEPATPPPAPAVDWRAMSIAPNVPVARPAVDEESRVPAEEAHGKKWTATTAPTITPPAPTPAPAVQAVVKAWPVDDEPGAPKPAIPAVQPTLPAPPAAPEPTPAPAPEEKPRSRGDNLKDAHIPGTEAYQKRLDNLRKAKEAMGPEKMRAHLEHMWEQRRKKAAAAREEKLKKELHEAKKELRKTATPLKQAKVNVEAPDPKPRGPKVMVDLTPPQERVAETPVAWGKPYVSPAPTPEPTIEEKVAAVTGTVYVPGKMSDEDIIAMVETLPLKQARLVYDKLKEIFGG